MIDRIRSKLSDETRRRIRVGLQEYLRTGIAKNPPKSPEQKDRYNHNALIRRMERFQVERESETS